MEIARVEGTVVSTIKTDRLKGHKLLLINILNPDISPTGNYVVAVDTVGAGFGEVVIVVRGSSARQTTDLEKVPTDTSIIAIVDTIEFKNKTVYEKSASGN